MNDGRGPRFPLLFSLRGLLFSIAVVLAALGVVVLLWCIVDAVRSGSSFDLRAMLQIVVCVWIVASAVRMLAFTEMIGVLAAIEANSRQSAERSESPFARPVDPRRALSNTLN